MSPPAILLSNLSFAYGTDFVLEHIDLEIPSGSFVGIIGPNGGGKTTLLKLLMGFIRPTHGTVLLFGKPGIDSRTKIGYVPQFHKCDRDFPITVLELVLLGALSKTNFWGIYPQEIKEKAEALIEDLGLTAHIHQSFGSLSGGLAQRALLARALISDPDLLLLDEPTANIDSPSIAAIMHRLEQLKQKKTILLVTHDLRTIAERVDHVLCVQKQIAPYLPQEICEHFAFGLYHTPLLRSHDLVSK